MTFPYFDLPPSSLICALYFVLGTNDTVRRQIKFHEHLMATMSSKWTLLLIIVGILHYPILYSKYFRLF